jgi:tRNA threonylcarbamoyladenosine biosynthesis protein TsaE
MKYLSTGPDRTKEIGFTLGKRLRPGDVVGLYGELGTGKTTMVKGIAGAFGIDERDTVSASFTIISEYDTIPRFFHVDLYRIDNKNELDEIGLWDIIGGDGIVVIEWADRAEELLSNDIIKVKLNFLDKDMREIIIEENDEKNRNNL